MILNSNSAVPRNTINGSVFFKTGSEGAIYVGGNPASGVAYALITGSVVGSNGMTKSGVGTLELANAQYTGATTINQGTVIFDSAANSGLNSGTRQTSVINLAGTALYAFTGGGVRATVNLAGDGSIGSADGFSLPFFGTVNGNGHELNITNTQTYGAVLFNGTANNVSQFNVNYGVLQIGASLGTTNAPIVVTDGANSATSELVITAGAFVANDIVLNQGSLGGGGNSGTSTITGSLTLTNAGGNVVTQGGSLVLAGSIRGSSPLLFQSTGGGVTISGSANTYTGSTEVSSGRLTVTGSIASSSSVQVGAGVPSTAILTGNGAASQVNLEGGGKLAPGISGAGTFTATGLKWDSDGTGQLQFNLGGTPAASSELSLGTGAFTKGAGSNFVFDFLNSGVAGQDYTLVTFGAGNTNFSLNDFMASDLAAGLNGTFSLSINGNVESLDFAVVEAPEPGTMALLVPGLIGLLLIAGWRRGQPARIAGE